MKNRALVKLWCVAAGLVWFLAVMVMNAAGSGQWYYNPDHFYQEVVAVASEADALAGVSAYERQILWAEDASAIDNWINGGDPASSWFAANEQGDGSWLGEVKGPGFDDTGIDFTDYASARAWADNLHPGGGWVSGLSAPPPSSSSGSSTNSIGSIFAQASGGLITSMDGYVAILVLVVLVLAGFAVAKKYLPKESKVLR